MASQLEDGAKSIADIESSVGTSLRTVLWRGHSGDQFRSDWTHVHAAQLRAVHDAIRGAAGVLKKNAQAQRVTSAAVTGGSLGAGVSPAYTAAVAAGGFGMTPTENHDLYLSLAEGKQPPDYILNQYPDLPWASRQGPGLIAHEATLSPQQQAQWWNSLSPGQQDALLLAVPGALLNLQGLPSDVRSRAWGQVQVEHDDAIASQIAKTDVEGSVKVKVVDLGAAGSVTETEMMDGRTTVDLHLEGSVGGDLDAGSGASAEVYGGATESYSFDNKAEADQFISGLQQQLTPQMKDVFDGAAGPALRVSHYLENNSYAHTDTTYEVGERGTVEAQFGANKVSLTGSQSVQYSTTTHQTTYTQQIDGTLRTGVDGAGAEATTSNQLSLTLGPDGTPVSAHLSGTVQSGAGFDLNTITGEGPGVDVSSMSGTEATYDVTVDLTNPQNQEALAHMLTSGVSTGDLQTLMKNSDATLQTFDYSKSSGHVDLVVAQGTLTHENDVSTHAAFHEAGGPWVTVQ